MKRYLDPSSVKTVVCSLVLSRLDYCNSLLVSLPDCRLAKLQRVQNRAARLVLGFNAFDRTSSTKMLRILHWLPVKARIEYKIALLCFKALHGTAPLYITELISPYKPGRHLRSENSHLLVIPRSKLISCGDRSFSKAGPSVWNSLPLNLRVLCNENDFKTHLKTFLFNKHLSI